MPKPIIAMTTSIKTRVRRKEGAMADNLARRSSSFSSKGRRGGRRGDATHRVATAGSQPQGLGDMGGTEAAHGGGSSGVGAAVHDAAAGCGAFWGAAGSRAGVDAAHQTAASSGRGLPRQPD